MSIYEFSVETREGATRSLSEYKGNVCLIVNTASKCGFTPQYKELQQLYDKYRHDGFEILAFPCNQFANQEPGSDREIEQFCQVNYGVTFPVFSKVDVKGEHAHPLFKYLSVRARGIAGTSSIKWNFTKFLVNREGDVIRRYAPFVNPLKLEAKLAGLLAEKKG